MKRRGKYKEKRKRKEEVVERREKVKGTRETKKETQTRGKGRKRETIDILKYNSLEFAIIYILKISNLN